MQSGGRLAGLWPSSLLARFGNMGSVGVVGVIGEATHLGRRVDRCARYSDESSNGGVYIFYRLEFS